MAIIWQDGFDLYNSGSDLAMDYVVAQANILTTGGRFGGGCVSAAGITYTTDLGYSLATPQLDLWTSFGMTTSSTNPSNPVVAGFSSNAGIEGVVTYNPTTGSWSLYRGNQNTLLGVASHALVGGWHWIDLHFKYHGTAGVFELWVDDAQVLDLTAQNTEQNGGQTGVVVVTLGDPNHNQALTVNYDDWFIYDVSTSRLGDSRIETTTVTSDASPNQGTPSAGTSHYAVVDEPQWSASDYITMPDTSGDKEVFGMSSIASTPATVFSVRVLAVSQKTDAGSFEIEPLVVSGGVESDGAASQLLTTSWSVQSAIFERDPNTSAAWTYTAANAAHIGYKVV